METSLKNEILKEYPLTQKLEVISNNVCLLTDMKSKGLGVEFKYLYVIDKMHRRGPFDTYTDLGDGFYLLDGGHNQKSFFDTNTLAWSWWWTLETHESVEDGNYILTTPVGDKFFFSIYNMLNASKALIFETWKKIEVGVYLLSKENGSKYFLHTDEMITSREFSFEDFERVKDGFYLLTQSDGVKRFYRVGNKTLSDRFMFETYEVIDEKIVITSSHGTKATLLDDLKLSSWSY